MKRSTLANKLIKLNIFFAIICLALIGISKFVKIPVKAEAAQTYVINSAEAFNTYASAYKSGARSPEDRLEITINSGRVVTTDGFISLGTSDRPFAGIIVAPASGVDTFHLYNCPLFDYVSTDLQLLGSGEIKIMRERANVEPGPGLLTSGSLFANHVVAGTRAASWKVNLVPIDGAGSGLEAYNYDSVIGDMAASASVAIEFTNSSSLNVVSSGNAGLICGTMGAGSTLEVKTASSGSQITVTSNGGNAGSLVGEMQSGATLKLSSANNTKVSTVTSSNAYAGGLVGKAINANIEFGTGISDYEVNGTIDGKNAGGIFGYYKNTDSSRTFSLLNTFAINTSMNINAKDNAGIIYGVLVNNGASFTFDGNGTSEAIEANVNGGSRRGGVCGRYEASSLTNTFNITNVLSKIKTIAGEQTVCISGGLIGEIGSSTATNGSYVHIEDITIELPNSGTTSVNGKYYNNGVDGGLIGTMGKNGSFVDVSGTITIKGVGKVDAGLIYNFSVYDNGKLTDSAYGVVRLQGITDLSAATFVNSASGQIMKNRDALLVYAIGDGEGTNSGWTLKRNTNDAIDHDDIYSWGEVLRLDGSTLKESDLFTVDDTNHTVTVKAEVLTMGTIVDFARTALNISLNTGKSPSTGALRFASSNASGDILGMNMSLTRDINLANTGLTGLTRDNGTNNAYSATFNGANHTISMATGEVYGLNASGAALASNSKDGYINNHLYNGLFAKTSGATISNLTVSGYFNIRQATSDMKLGVIGQASGSLTISKLTSNFTINLVAGSGQITKFGGAIGEATGNLNATISGSSSLYPTLVDISDTSVSSGTYSNIGGAIGYLGLGDGTSQSISFDTITSGVHYYGTGTNGYPTNTNKPACFGGLIGTTGHSAYNKNKRTVTINNVTINLDIKGNSKNNTFGGALGREWLSLDTEVTGLTVNATVSAVGNSNNFGFLTQTATGHMAINSINLSTASYTLPASSSNTFGFVANKAYKGTEDGDTKSALYLDVDNTSNNYNISGLTFTTDPTFSVYDELVADSRFNAQDITNNGNAIISITTTDTKYLNKTTYGKNDAKALNPYTRYYYNLATARANLSTAKYKFLVWSVGRYAYSSLSSWFTVDNTTFTGDLDMTGLSYYPIDVSGVNVTFDTATIKLDNKTTETNVTLPYTGSSAKRTTREATNQHYLMHTGLFRNYLGSITIESSIIQGNVPKLSDSFCGFIVTNTIGNSDTSTAKITINGLTVDGLQIINNDGTDLTTTAYAPLLVNKVGKNTKLSMSNASQANYSGFASKYVASSLFGDVGSADARAIYVTFSGIKFDGRSTASSIGNMDTTYGTTKSIFSRATLLNSFLYYGESSGAYNFEITDDWSNSTTAIHNVTYGKEITSSVEYLNTQKLYAASEYYVHPTTYQSTSEYSFATGFLPYVYTAYNENDNKHELRINLSFSTAIQGAGKYGDPYIITDGDMLKVISNIIAGVNVGSDVTIELPSTLTDSNNEVKYNYVPSSINYSKIEYTFGTDNFTATGQTSISTDIVRQYLSGAYYKINTDITLDSEYDSLGRTNIPFKGVIFGQGATITNKSPKPLIKNSTGCVIKGININVDVYKNNSSNITLAAPLGSDLFQYENGIETYGALIAQVMGGDTIIDTVNVTFTNAIFNLTAASGSRYVTLIPVGGYIGTLLNGGVIFRGMTSSNVGITSSVGITKTVSSVTSSVDEGVANSGYLYFNPIIGRVIAGYAFHETTTYHGTEDTATLKNGLKNYTIADLVVPSKDSDKLGVKNDGKTITVPNGQSMFILGAIVNSGAGSAGSATGAYQTINTFWQAYRADTTARGTATYADIGSMSTSDYNLAKNDSLYGESTDTYYGSNTMKTPYIIWAYTTAISNQYHARRITSDDKAVVNITGDCDVPAGFRGIGNIYYDNVYLRLRVITLNGASTGDKYAYQVTLHMRFLEYAHGSVTAYRASDANGKSATAGLGLFNFAYRGGTNEYNRMTFSNVILSGSVFYDVYGVNGVKSNYYFNRYDGDNYQDGNNKIRGTIDGNSVNYSTNLSVGGLIGYTQSAITINNVTFNNLEVEGAKTAGGIIGFLGVNGADNSDNVIDYINFDSTSTTYGYVNVVGGLTAGGLVGRIWAHKLEVNGKSDRTDIIIKTVEVKCGVPNEVQMAYGANVITGAGGIVGSSWSARKGGGDKLGINKSYSGRRLYIYNINIVGLDGNTQSSIKIRNNSDDNPAYNNYAGGFIGSAHGALIRIGNSSISKINISANSAGGIVGKLTQKYNLYLDNVTINGDNGIDANYYIKGTRHAGGIVGFAIGRDNFYMDLENVKIYSYDIISSYTGTTNIECNAGGIFGIVTGSNKGDTVDENLPYELNNIHIKECNITTNYGANSNNFCGTGGIAGALTGGSHPDSANINVQYTPSDTNANRVKISGYNILLEDNVIKHLEGGTTNKSTASTNQAIGEVVGNNRAGSSIRIVGISIKYTGENEYCRKICGKYGSNNEEFGTSSWTVTNTDYSFGAGQIIFADYYMNLDNDAFSNIGDSSANVEAAEPYVTVNPKVKIGGYDFIGDAFATPVDGKIAISSLPIADILSDNPSSNNASIYSYIGNKFYSGSSGNTNYYNARLAYNKLSMFASEIAQTDDAIYLDTDFPVLILEESNPTITINSYIRMITNSTYDYSIDQAGHFSVTIYKMVYDTNTNKFEPTTVGASLQKDENGFYTIFNVFDSGKMQFSLIDVSYYNPTRPENVAFHIYLPVFVKKVLSYGFDIAVQGGTTYLESEYTDKFGQALIENIGSPVTAYFRYTYSKTAADWTTAINSGENVMRYYNKSLLFYKANTSETLADLNPNTMLALSGPNNDGKVYYARLGDVLLSDGITLDLSKFRQKVYSNGEFIDGDYFQPAYLSDLMDITVSTSGDKAFVNCDAEHATVKVGDAYYRLAEEGETPVYSITVNGDSFQESYYLTFFTEQSSIANAFHYYLITSPASFAETEYPAKILDTGGHTMVHLVMGKIFDHTDFNVKSDTPNQTTIMTADNHTLEINMSARFGLRTVEEGMDADIRSYLQSLIANTNVYQSFLVQLNRYDGVAIQKVISGNPTGAGTYGIDYVLDGTAAQSNTYGADDIRINHNYAEFVSSSLSSYFASGDAFEIVASVSLTYNTSAAISAQFPGQSDNFPDNGTTVTGSSHLSFIRSATASSKNELSMNETPARLYYSEDTPEYAALNLNPVEDRVGNISSMGINALNPKDTTTASFDLLAVLDTTTVRAQVEEYTSATVEFELRQKVNGEYGNELTLSDYLVSIKVGDTTLTAEQMASGIISLPLASLSDDGAYIEIPIITVTVKTGSALEAQHYLYSNYKFTVLVTLYDGNNPIASSHASNFVIYTNARVVPDFIVR